MDLVEEDDYDADMDAEAAPLTSTTVSAVPAAAAVTQHTPAPAAVVAANGVAIQLPPTGLPPPGFAQLTAPLQVHNRLAKPANARCLSSGLPLA